MLVATDIAARGLDIVQLPLVVNFDLPLVAEDYIHRAGRTGRAGLAGRAVSLVSPADRDLLRDIQRLLPSPIEHVVIEGFAVTAGSQDALPEAGRRHQGSRGRGSAAISGGIARAGRVRRVPAARAVAASSSRPRVRARVRSGRRSTCDFSSCAEHLVHLGHRSPGSRERFAKLAVTHEAQ